MRQKLLNFINKKWDLIILSGFIVSFIVVLSTFAFLRHDAFASNFDLANMDQTVWNTINGNFFSLTGEKGTVSRFSIHADLILVLLSPLYLIWNNVKMLIMSAAVIVALGAIPTYLLSKKILKNKVYALIISAVYLLNPATQWTIIYDFHSVSLAITFLLTAFYFAYSAYTQKKSLKKTNHHFYWRWYFIFVVLALLTKEQISLYISILGLAIFFVFKKRKIGFITFIVGIIWFITMVYYVIPHLSPNSKYWAMDLLHYSQNTDVNKTIWQSLGELFDKFFLQPESLTYYASLLKPYGFLPLLGLPWLVFSLPELAINVLSTNGMMRIPTYHYVSGITPSLIIAMIFGLQYLSIFLNKISKIKHKSSLIMHIVMVGLLAVAIRSNYNSSPLPTTPSCKTSIYNVSQEDKDFESLLQKIPQSASVTASGNVRPHISQRINTFTIPSATHSADFVAILTEQRIPGDFQPIELDIVNALKNAKDYTLVDSIGKFYLFKRIK